MFIQLNTPLPLLNVHPTTLDYNIRYTIYEFKIDPHTDPLDYMAPQPSKNRECAFRNMMCEKSLAICEFIMRQTNLPGSPLGERPHTSK